MNQYNNDISLKGKINKIYDRSYYWDWHTNSNRSKYRELWKSSETAKNNLRFVVGAMILNRIVSAINAARLVKAFNRNIKSISWNINFSVRRITGLDSEITLNFSTAI